MRSWRGWRWWLWIYESAAGGWCFVWRGQIWHIKKILPQDTTLGAIYGRMPESERQWSVHHTPGQRKKWGTMWSKAMSKERVITFRGEDHTIVIHDAQGNWSIYRGGDNNEIPFDSLTEAEQQELNDYIHDWRAES